MNIIIAGSRTYDNYEQLKNVVDKFIKDIGCDENIQIISGTAKGADQLGERYAEERGYLCKRIPADWNLYGKSAGYKRNENMAKISDACIVFWDGKSKGTYHMINLAKQYELVLKIEKF